MGVNAGGAWLPLDGVVMVPDYDQSGLAAV